MAKLKTIITFFLCFSAFSATKNDPHFPVDHCYHWLDEAGDKYLSFKYEKAQETDGELTFFTTPGTSNGSAAGPGLYCAKSPSGSYDYGDRLIRIDLVDDVVLLEGNTNIQYCGFDGTTSQNSQECAEKTWDIKFFRGGGIGNKAWYVIQNPMAIEHWSANSTQLEQDLQNSIQINGSSFKYHANKTIEKMQSERSHKGSLEFHNPKARLSLLDLINSDPEILDNFPAMNIVSRLASDKANKVALPKRLEIYRKYLPKAMKDKEIVFQDIQRSLEKDPRLKELFFSNLDLYLALPGSANALTLFQALDTYPDLYNRKLKDAYQRQLISLIFENPAHLESFGNQGETITKKAKKWAFEEISQLKQEPLDIYKTKALIPLINKLYNRKDAKKERNYWRNKLLSTLEPTSISLRLNDEIVFFDEDTSKNNTICPLYFDLNTKGNNSVELHYYQNNIPNYGSTTQELCTNLSDNLTSLSLIPESKTTKFEYYTKGNLQGSSFLFAGNSRQDFEHQCHQFYQSSTLSPNVHTISYTLNDRRNLRARNRRRFWTTVDEVCQAFEESLKEVIPVYSNSSEDKLIEAQSLVEQTRTNSQVSTSAYKLSGKIEDIPFFFFGNNREELAEQCSQVYELIARPEKVSYFSFGLNSQDEKTYQHTEYLKDVGSTCDRLLIESQVPTKKTLRLQKAREEFNQKSELAAEDKAYKVIGRFGQIQYYFVGENREDIEQQCRSFFPLMENQASLRRIYHSVNDSSEQSKRYRYGVLETVDNLCSGLTTQISSEVPTKQMIINEDNRAQLISKYKKLEGAAYKLSGRFGSNEFYFAGNNQEEVINQCLEFFPHLDNNENIHVVRYSVNDSGRQRHRSGRYWTSKEDACASFGNAIKASVPTIETIRKRAARVAFIEKNKSSFAINQSPVQVEGNIQRTIPFHFHGQDKVEIRQQCLDFYPLLEDSERIHRLNFKVNGVQDSQVYQRDYFTGANDLCDALINSITLTQ